MTQTDPVADLARVRSQISKEAQRTALDWFERQVHCPGTRMYLYFRPNEISFDIQPERPGPEWQLAQTSHVSVAATKEQVAGMICELANRLPILGSSGTH